MIDELLKKLDVPESDSSTPIKDNEAKFIYEFVKSHRFQKTLETGCGYGKSAVSIMAATGKRHIVIDPFQSSYKYWGINNIKKAGFENALDYREKYSHSVLPELLEKGEKFDFIFIDGDHRFDGQFIDFYYADLILEEKGFILFHDTWMRSTAHMESYIDTNRKDYQYIKTGLRNLALFQKTEKDKRGWMHFKGFATSKSLMTNSVIEWLHGPETPAKKIVKKIKDVIK
ncbi:MAG: class I SAM-dependent methyltransferase [Bacteroidota bacterium]